MSEADSKKVMQDYFTYTEASRQRRVRGGNALQPTNTATTVRVRDGKRTPTDGRSPRPRSSSAATTSSTRRISTRRSISPREIPGAAAAAIEVRPLMESAATATGARATADAATSETRSTRVYRERVGARARNAHPRSLGDFDVAEEALQEAFTIALEQWERDGVPDEPARVARARRRATRRSIGCGASARSRDKHALARERRGGASRQTAPRRRGRRSRRRRSAAAHLHLLPPGARPRGAGRADAAHALRPRRPRRSRAPFSSPEPTMAQRLVRAKARFAPPASPIACRRRASCRTTRCGAARSSISCSTKAMRRRRATRWFAASCAREAIRLGPASRALMPDEPEVHRPAGADAAARRAARRASRRGRRDRAARGSGPLALGSRRRSTRGSRWSSAALRTRAARALRDAGGDRRAARRAGAADDTDWPADRGALRPCGRLHRSPVVALNHAVAVAMVERARSAACFSSTCSTRADAYHLFHATRADLLRRLGRRARRRRRPTAALARTENEAERRFISSRLAQVERRRGRRRVDETCRTPG